MSGELTIATLNLWGLNAPADYTARRGEVRGALPGSPATTMRPSGGAWHARRRRLAADAVRRSGAAIVGLQEDHQDLAGSMPGSTHGSQSEQLAADLGLDGSGVRRITTVREGGVPKGNAILARSPILWTERLPLPAGEGEEGRFGPGARDALYATIDTPIGFVHFFVVHFTTRGQHQQLEEATELLEHVERLASGGTAIVVGDLNAKPTSPTLSLLTRPTAANGFRLRDAWAEANPHDLGFTMPIHSPRTPQDTHMRIDYVLVGPGPEISGASLVANAPDPDGFYASDHFGVAATLRCTSA